MTLSVVASPEAESDLVVILSLLEAEGIPFFVHGGGVGGLFPGLQINAVNARRVMVPTEYAERAFQALAVLPTASVPEPMPVASRIADAIRMLVEFFCMGVFVPRRDARRPDDTP